MWWGKSKQADVSKRSQLPESVHGHQLSRPQPLISALEPRMMFDGAVAATVASDVSTADAAAYNPHGDAASAESNQAVSDSSEAGAVADAQSGGRKEIVFVDTRVPDYQALLQSVSADAEVVLLSTDQNGVQQIAGALQARSGIDAIHIISHGDAGVLLLGNAPLFEGNLSDYSSQLQSIGESLTTDGDILLYGCEVGAGSEGQAFLSQLASITGADIAASVDNTGGIAKGGNWDLEITTGDVAASYALNLSQLGSYDHVLVTTSVNSVAGLKAAIATGNTDGVADVITLTGNITFASAADAIAINVTDGQTMSIVGGGFTLDAAYYNRALNVSGGSVAISDLTITHGAVSGNGAGSGSAVTGSAAHGGAILNAGTLTLTDVTVTQNIATGGGGGGGVIGGSIGGGGGGGSGAGGIGGGNGGNAGGGGGEYSGVAGGSGSGGRGGGYQSASGFMGGRGGTSSGGGAGGLSSYGYSAGGVGGSATAGGVTIGGGGGGAGWDANGGTGGAASGAIYNTGTLTIIGTSAITNNIGAGGGGGGGGGAGNHAGVGGLAVGGIWNAGGTVQITSANYAAMTGNTATSGSIGSVTNSGSNAGYSSPVAVARIYNSGGTVDTNYNPNATPTIGSLNGDSVAWAGVGSTVTLDSGGNANLGDTDLEALNGGTGNWSGATLTVQRNGTAVSIDTLGFNTSGALFTVSGSDLQSGGQTFATFTNTGGVLTISFTSSATAATTALVNDIAQRITYRSDTPAGDATLRFTLSDGTASTTADVTVTSDFIYVTNTTDTATINLSNGVSFSEAVAIAAADVTGSQTLIFSSSFNSTMTLAGALAINESLTINGDSASGLTFSGSTITLGGGTTLNFTNSTGTVTIASALAGTGSLSKAGAGTLALSSTSNNGGWSGAMSVTGGTLTAGAGSNPAATLSSGTLTLDGATLAMTVTGAAGTTSTFANSVVLGASGGTIDVGGGGGANIANFSGVISGSGSLTKTAAAILQLDGNNTYTGATNVSAGTLIANHNNALGTTAGATTVSSGATVRVASGLTIGEAFTISGTGKTVSVDYGALHLTSGTSSLSGTITLAADANVSAASGSTFTLSGALDGAFNLNKTDAGTLALSNAGNSTTLSGGISVSAGTLSVASDNHLSSGGLTLASGSTLAVTGATNIDNAIALTGDATVSNSANATLSGVISGANTLTKAGASTLTLSNTNTYAGTTVSAGTLSVASDGNLGSGSLSLAGGTTLEVTGATTIDNAIVLAGNAIVNTSANATLSGVISGVSNLSKTGAATLTLANTNTYGGTTTVSAGTLSLASDSNLGSGGLTLAAGSTLALTGATTIDNAVTLSGAATVSTTADATLAGNIGGAGSLAKTGANTLTLSGSNSYAGTTTVSAGTLSVAGDGNLGSSTVTLAAGTTLAVTGATTIDNAIALSGNATVQAADAVTLSGTISGAGGLTKTGAGTLTLSGSNGFTGNVALSAGGLTLSNGAAIDDGSALSMLAGTTLTLSASETIGSLAGTGTVALGANTLTAGGNNTSTSFAGSIGGTGGGLSKAGAGTFTLSGTNSYTGATTISAGAIETQNGDAIGNSSAVSVSSGAFLVLSAAETIGSLAGAGSVSQGANTLTTGGNNSSTTFSGDLNGNGALVKEGSGTLTLSNAGNSGSMSGDITVSAGTLSVASDNHLSSGTLTLAGGSTLAVTGATNIDNAITLTGDATVSNSANATLSGVISGASNLSKAGASTLTLSGNNTYSGTTTVSAGTLSVASDGNLGSGAVSLAGGTTLAISGATIIDNAIVLAGNATVSTSANATLSGVISGANNLTKAGASTLTLSGSNTYSITTVSAGTLSVSSDANLGSGAVTLASGSTLAVTGATTIDNAIVLSGGTATVNAAANATLSGNITGAGGFTKAGASTLTLSGSDSYTGATNVGAGTLLVNGTLSATSNTTVASAATLGGSGTISSDVTVNSGGTLSPGNSAGTMTVNGNLTMAAGSTLAVEINGATAGTGYDQVIVNGNVDVSGATLSVTHGYSPGSGDSYTIIVNDAADAVTGSFSGLVEGATVTAGGNGTILTASYIGGTGNDFTLTAPVNPTVSSVSSISGDSTYKVGDTVVMVVNFSEAVFLSTGTIQLMLETGTTDRAATYLAGSGSSSLYFSYTVQEGDISSDLDFTGTTALVANGDTIQSGSFIDANLTLPSPGAAGSIAASKDIVIDGVRPTASIVVADTALAVGEISTVTITFNEAVSGLAIGDFTVANGVLSGLSSGDGGITWTATLTPTASTTDTSNLITLDNTGVVDAAGNTGSGTTDSNNYAIDTLRPTASIVVADTALAAGETSTVTITFNEAVTGLAIGDFTVANGALSGLSSGDGGITWTATLTPTANTTDTSNLITLDNTGVADAAGNTGTGTTDSNNYAIDTLRPTASIVVADTALAAGESTTVTITFNEAVTGLTTADFTVANGVLSGLSSGDGGITWTATLTPAVSIEDTTNLITLDNTGVADAAGNTGTGTTDSNNYAIDTLRPTASIVVADTALAAGESSTVTITFNEAVTGLTTADFTVANGTLSGLSSGDGGITWTATLTPTANTTDTSNLITLDNTGVADAAGNTGTGTTDSNNYAIDTLRPTASIVVADTALAAGESTTVTITFNEAVTGLTTADFTVANGVLSGLSSGDGGITWTATLTPTANTTDTSNLITLDNTGVADAAGNTGTGTTDSNNYAIDTLRPTASIVVADTALAAGESTTVTITFNEAVTGLTTADFTVANGVLSGLSSGDGGITWTATLTPTASVEDTTNLITLDNTGVADAAGNTGTGTTDSNNYAIDTLRPTASIVVVDTPLAVGETTTVTITFNEAVTGLTTADFTVANGVLSGLSTGDGGITWTATLTPTANITDTSNLITLDNTGVADAAGNIGSGTTDSNNYAIDTLRPTASIVVADTALAAGESSTVTITFNEAVTGLTTADFTVANGTLSGLSSGDGGITWTATLTPAASVEDTTNLITLDNTGLTDLAGNAGAGTTDSNNYAVDTLRPTATIVVADTLLTTGETTTVTITFNEAVSGLTADDFTVANGALSGLSSADGGITWTATLTPAANINDASNIITLANAGVVDAAGNSGIGSTDSNNYVIDSADPQVSITLSNSNPTNAASVGYTLTFSEAVNNVDVSDFRLVTTGTASGVIQSVVQLDAQTYQVTLSNLSGAGSLALELVAGSDISDLLGNLVAGTIGPAYTRDVLSGDPEFRVTPTPPPVIAPPPPPPSISLPPPPALLPPLMPPSLFEVPGLGGGLPPLGNIFLQNQALAPSFLAQVFSSSSGDGSGIGFLGFGGGDGGVFGTSTLSSMFGDLVPQDGAVDIFGGDNDGVWELEEEGQGFLGAPTLGQQLDSLRNSELQQIDQLARAFGEWAEKAPVA